MVSLREIIKEMLAQKTRLFLTVLAIAWSTASIAIMLSVGEGMRQHFGETMSSVGKMLLVVSPGTTSLNFDGKSKGVAVTLSREDVASIAQLPEVTSVVTEYNFTAELLSGSQSVPTYPAAVASDFSLARNIEVFDNGRFLNEFDLKDRRHVIVLGNRVAKSLLTSPSTSSRKHRKRPSLFNDAPLESRGAKQLIGTSVKLNNHVFTVVGVAKDKMQMSSYGATDNYTVWIPSTTYELLSGDRYFSNVIVTPENPEDNDALQSLIKRVVGRNHGFDPEDPAALQFWDSYEQQASTNQFFLGMQFFLGLIGFITLIVAGVGIANVMTVSVRNATREIGIRMAIGARAYHIMMHYVIEALIATFIGGALGLFVTTFVVTGINQLRVAGPFATMLDNFKPVLSPSVLFVVITLLGLTGLLAAWFPAKRASKIDPIKALQYE